MILAHVVKALGVEEKQHQKSLQNLLNLFTSYAGLNLLSRDTPNQERERKIRPRFRPD